MRNLITSALAAAVILVPSLVFAKVGGGDVKYNPKGAGRVIFRHEYHVNLKGQKCTNCHYKPFQMTSGSYKMDMNTLTKGQFCGLCHNGKDAFGLTGNENCKKCHEQ